MRNERSLEKRQSLVHFKLVSIIKQYFSHSSFNRITITRVQLGKSLDMVKVFYLPFQNSDRLLEKDIKSKLIALQTRLYQSLRFKKPLAIKFIYDKGLSHSLKIDKIISDLHSSTDEIED